jgi:hypothetical protein
MEFASARRAPPELACLVAALAVLAGAACHGRHDVARTAAPAAPSPAPAVRLAGQVLDGRAHPVPDARVLAFPLADGGAGAGEPARAAADLDGRFAFEHLPPGAYRLLVEAAGFPTAEASPVSAPAGDLVLHVAGEGRTIRGRVVRGAGEPAGGARVLLGDEAGGPARETTSGADGRFAFGGLGEGSYALRAVAGRLASATLRGIAAGRDGTNLPAPLALGPGETIGGRVVEDGGGALGGVEVRVESTALAAGEDPIPTVARTDRTGAFSAGPLAPGGYRLTAARPGHVLRRAPTLDLPGPGPPAPLLLELLRGARVTGRITDARGGAAAGAHVRCVASAMDDLTVLTGQLPLAAEAAAMRGGRWAARAARSPTRTGASLSTISSRVAIAWRWRSPDSSPCGPTS